MISEHDGRLESSGRPSASIADEVVLRIDKISKRYGSTNALQNVSFTIGTGQVHGLCGQNGAGKSTLVKLLTGQVQPDSGEIFLKGKKVELTSPQVAQIAGIAVVDQEISLVPALTIAENLFLGTSGEPLFRSLKKLVDRAEPLLAEVGLDELSPLTRVESLPLAHRQLIEIARLLARRAKLLILDEPTATLTRADSQIVFQALRDMSHAGRSVLYVSHRLDEVLDLCDTITVLRDSQVITTRPVKGLSQPQLVEFICGDTDFKRSQDNSKATYLASRDYRSVEMRVSIPDLIPDIRIKLYPGEIVALAGQMGSGASEILRGVAGLYEGAIIHVTFNGKEEIIRTPFDADHIGIRFVTNDRKNEGLFLNQSVVKNLTVHRTREHSRFGFLLIRKLFTIAQAFVGQLDVKTPNLKTRVSALSGGNQQKVLIGRSLMRDGNNLLLFDEPTRGVDVKGRSEIHQTIRSVAAHGVAVVFVSGEPDEVFDLADRIVCLENGIIVSDVSKVQMTMQDLIAMTTRASSSIPKGNR